MCGRFSLGHPENVVIRFPQFHASFDLARPRYNVAPAQTIAAVKNDATNAIVPLHWGLIPSWAKDAKVAYRTVNARVETVAEKPSFRSAFRRRRCLVFADGYYEWVERLDDQGIKRKYPFYFRMKSGEPFAFAGLWEVWQPPTGEPIESCTIITSGPNDLVGTIHDRQPVILHDSAFESWLTPDVLDAAVALEPLVPYPASEMEVWEVSPAVNSARYTAADCIVPIAGVVA